MQTNKPPIAGAVRFCAPAVNASDDCAWRGNDHATVPVTARLMNWRRFMAGVSVGPAERRARVAKISEVELGAEPELPRRLEGGRIQPSGVRRRNAVVIDEIPF